MGGGGGGREGLQLSKKKKNARLILDKLSLKIARIQVSTFRQNVHIKHGVLLFNLSSKRERFLEEKFQRDFSNFFMLFFWSLFCDVWIHNISYAYLMGKYVVQNRHV